MAALGTIGVWASSEAPIIVFDVTRHMRPPAATYIAGIPAASAPFTQALRRWTGTVWEPIQMSYWNGSTWLLGEPE